MENQRCKTRSNHSIPLANVCHDEDMPKRRTYLFVDNIVRNSESMPKQPTCLSVGIISCSTENSILKSSS